MKILYSLYLVRTQDILFDALEFQQRYRENPFALGDTYLTPFSMCEVAFCTTHGKNNMRKCDNGGFVPVTSLNDVVGSPSLFISYLIGITGKI